MNRVLSCIAVAAALGASSALAQMARGGATAPGSPGAGAAPPGTLPATPATPGSPSAINPNAAATPSVISPSVTTPGRLPSTQGGTGLGNSTVAQQAESRRQLAFQQCQAMSGSSQSDCIRQANEDFARATQSNDPLLEQGQGSVAGSGSAGIAGTGTVAGSTRSTPDVSPTSPDNPRLAPGQECRH